MMQGTPHEQDFNPITSCTGLAIPLFPQFPATANAKGAEGISNLRPLQFQLLYLLVVMPVTKRITGESAQQQADQQVVVAIPVVSFRVSTITVMMPMTAAMAAMTIVTVTMAAMLAVTVTTIVTVPVSAMVPVAGQRRTGHAE